MVVFLDQIHTTFIILNTKIYTDINIYLPKNEQLTTLVVYIVYKDNIICESQSIQI